MKQQPNKGQAAERALAMLNEHTKTRGRFRVTLADLVTLPEARAAAIKDFGGWPLDALFISVDTLVARYADMTTAERIDECNGEHVMGWFEEQGDDDADEEGEFMSTPGHYWPDHPTHGDLYATIDAVEAPSVEDYRDALEHGARGGLLSLD